MAGDRELDVPAETTLALDFDLRPPAQNPVHPDAIVVLASRLRYRQYLEISRRRHRAPLLLVVYDGEVGDRIDALEFGADAVLVGPCDPCEMLAYLRALLRRTGPDARDVFEIVDLHIDAERMIARRGNRSVELSSTELAVLTVLAHNAGSAVPLEVLMQEVWAGMCTRNTVQTFIYYLRAKLNLPGERRLIELVRGVGYTLYLPLQAPGVA